MKEAAKAARDEAVAAKESGAAHAEAAKHAKELADQQAAGAEKAAAMAKSMGQFALSMLGLDSGRAVLTAVIDEFARGRNTIFKSVELVNAYREAVLELAALKGHLGGTTEETRDQFGFRAQTLQTAEAARQFELRARGVGQAAIGHQISEAEFRRALIQAGEFQAAENTSPGAHGLLTGLLPTLSKREMTGEEVFQKEAQLFYIFQPGGFTFTEGVEQFAHLAPMIAGGTYSDTGLAALLSAFSVNDPGTAATKVEQFTRATLGAVGRMRGAVMADSGYDIEKTGTYLRNIGATDEYIKNTPEERIAFAIAAKIRDDLITQRDAAVMRGESFSVDIYLKSKGYGNVTDLKGLKQYFALMDTGALDNTFMPLAEAGYGPKAAADLRARIAHARAVDPAMNARQAKLSEEAARLAAGVGQAEYLDSLRRAAFANRKARGEESYDTYEDMRALPYWGLSDLLYRHHYETDREAQRMLFAEAQRLGLPLPELHRDPFGNEPVIPDEELFKLSREVLAKGGSILPGTAAPVQELLRKLDEQKARENLRPMEPVSRLNPVTDGWAGDGGDWTETPREPTRRPNFKGFGEGAFRSVAPMPFREELTRMSPGQRNLYSVHGGETMPPAPKRGECCEEIAKSLADCDCPGEKPRRKAFPDQAQEELSIPASTFLKIFAELGNQQRAERPTGPKGVPLPLLPGNDARTQRPTGLEAAPMLSVPGSPEPIHPYIPSASTPTWRQPMPEGLTSRSTPPQASGWPSADREGFREVVAELKEIRRQLTPRPMAPEPGPFIGRPPTMTR